MKKDLICRAFTLPILLSDGVYFRILLENVKAYLESDNPNTIKNQMWKSKTTDKRYSTNTYATATVKTKLVACKKLKSELIKLKK